MQIGKTISHYTILEKLGEGGMGVVFKAQDLTLDRLVAMKFLPAHLSSNPGTKARFLQEAKAAAALNHPNILAVHEIDTQDDAVFIVMEYLHGQTLKAHIAGLQSGSGISVDQSIDWALRIAEGLRAAHQNGIVHRDIKSENIMVDGRNTIKIMDFGLAKLKHGSGVTQAGASLGTLSYMSPEQAQGVAADHRSDIWSLGVVFFEMLTADLPFKAEHEAALLYLIANEETPVPSAFDRRIPHYVDTVVSRMLAKDREQRYESAEQVIEALQLLRADLAASDTASASKSIIVLPFKNISGDKENEYFGDGLSEELIVNLSRLKEIELVSSTTSTQYKGTKKDIRTIGRELGVRYILEGSVRKFQDNLRIAVQLVDVEIDRQLWAESFKGTMADVFDIQEEVSRKVVDALRVKLTPVEEVSLTKRSTVHAEAFDYYLRAREFLYRRTKNSLHFAIQLFQKAIEIDTRYAVAYAGLGEAYATLHYDYDTKDMWIDRAIESSLKALMYDSTVSEAYAALALAYFSKKSLQEAEAAALRAIDLGPNVFTGYWVLARIYHVTDRDRESVALLKKTIELNPDFHTAYMQLRMAYQRLGDAEAVRDIIATVLEVLPRYLDRHPDDARSHNYYASELVQVGRIEEAKAEAAKAVDLSPGDPLMMYNTACFYSLLGESDMAVASLRSSIGAGLEDYDWIKTDPDFDRIREHPGYIELMKDK